MDSSSNDLPALVQRARSGDEEAWQQIYRSFYPRMMAFARLRLDPDRAAEAVSETVVRAVGTIHRFTWKGKGFEAWLFRILRNVVIDFYRRNGHGPARILQEDDGHVEGDVADAVIDDEEAMAVRAAFERLSAADQELLHLRVIQEMDSEQVALVLGKKAGAVRMAQVRALERLRAGLAEMGYQ